MNEIDAITNIIYGKMQKSLPGKDYVVRNYTGGVCKWRSKKRT